MPKPPPITMEAAARLISGNDARLVDAADRLLSWSLLLSPAITGSTVGLALLDPKNELIRLTRRLISGARTQAQRRQGVSRTQLLQAGQALTVLAAFFEAVADELGELYRQLELTDDEKAHLASRAATSRGERLAGDARSFAGLEIPAPDPGRGWEEALADYRRFYGELAGLLERFVTGLAVWDRWDGRVRSTVKAALRSRVPERATVIFLDAYRELAAQFPEFFVWVSLGEHAATRRLVSERLADVQRLVEGPRSAAGPPSVYEGPAYPRLAYREEIDPLIAFYTRLFVGREAELAQVMAVAAQARPGYVLVEAPPGHGKSALAAELVRRWEVGRWNGPTPSLVYFFVREDAGRQSSGSFCAAVSSQLLELLDERGGVPPDLESQRSQLLRLWADAVSRAQADKPLVLLVDGLDEMADEGTTIAQLLPGRLGPYVHVIVTSRPHPQPLAQVGVEHPFRQPVDVLRLGALGRADVESLLRELGSPARSVPALATRVLKITSGEPLLARFVTQDVATSGEVALASLDQEPPDGVKAYFHGQFALLEAHAQGEAAWEVLGMLLVAHGPMSFLDLAGALNRSVWQIRRAVQPIRRFLLGDKQLEFMHAELRAAVAEQFSPVERRDLQRRLLAWCTSHAEAGWPDDTSGYVLAHYAAHLSEAEARAELYSLISRRWMELKATRTHSRRAFAQDVLLAIEAARSDHPPDLVQQIRGSLVYATICSQAASVPSRVLATLVRTGQRARAEGLAALISDPGKRSGAYREIGGALLEQAGASEARAPILEALGSAQTIEGAEAKAEELTALASLLVRVGEPQRAVDAAAEALWAPLSGAWYARDNEVKARKIASRIRTVAEVVVLLAEAGASNDVGNLVDRAVATAQRVADIDTGFDEMDWSVLYAEDGASNDVGSLVGRPVAPAQGVGDVDTGPGEMDWSVVYALVELAWALAKAEQPARALEVVRAIEDPDQQARVFADLAAALTKAGHREPAERAAQQAVAAAQRIVERDATRIGFKYDSAKAQALTDIMPPLVSAGWSTYAFAAAQAVDADADETAWAGYEYGSVKANALADLAWACIRNHRFDDAERAARQAVGAARDAWSPLFRDDPTAKSGPGPAKAEALAELVRSLAAAERPEEAADAAEQALAAARVISGAPATSDEARYQYGWGTSTPVVLAYAVADLSRTLARAGHHDQATLAAGQSLAIAQTSKGNWIRGRLLAELCEFFAESGQPDHAGLLAQHAFAAVEAIGQDPTDVFVEEYGFVKARSFENLAWVLGRAGQLDLAEQAAEQALEWAQLIEGYMLDDEFAGVAAGVHRLGRTKLEALTSVADTFVGLAVASHDAGQLERAARATNRALAAARAIPNRWARAEALAELSWTFADAGQSEPAGKVAEEALSIAQTVVEVDDGDREWSIGFGYDSAKAMVLSALADELARRDQVDQAFVTIQAIGEPPSRAQALVRLGHVLAEAGHPDWGDQASSLAVEAAQDEDWSRSHRYRPEKALGLVDVARALAGVGQQAHASHAARLALSAALAIEDTRERLHALERLFNADIAAEDWDPDAADLALGAAQALKEPQAKVKAYRLVMVNLVRLGQRARAQEVAKHALEAARAITSSWSRDRALGDLARVFARFGMPELAAAAASQATEQLQAESDTGVGSVPTRPGPTRPAATGPDLEAILVELQAIEDPQFRARELASLAMDLDDPDPLAQAAQAAGEAITAAAIVARSELFSTLVDVGPVVIKHCTTDELVHLSQAVIEVEQWWWNTPS